jgi:hypothetical protein
MWKDFLLAFSFTNMAFVNLWTKFFYGEKYYNKLFPTTNSYLALMINELLFTLVFWGGIQLVRRLNKRYVTAAAKFFVCFMTLCFINVVILDLRDTIPNFNDTLVKDIIILATIGLIIKKWMTKTVLKFLQIFAPFILIIWGQSVFGIYQDLTAKKPVEPVIAASPVSQTSPRVLWMLFDEMDQRIAFKERPAAIKLPEFDRLRGQSLYAVNAYPPADSTMCSLPSLISGKVVTGASFETIDRMLLNFQGESGTVNWGNAPSIFRDARRLKLNTAMIGEFLPYSRLLRGQLNYSYWTPYKYDYVPARDTLGANISAQLFGLFHSVNLHYRQHQISYRETMKSAKQVVADPKYGLIFIHFPIPHGPYFAGQPWWDRSEKGYAGNLMLADRSLGELRRLMEKKGVWDSTTVISSSDHWLRNYDFDGKMEKRVPYLIKFPGQKTMTTFKPDFNTVLTKDLVLAIYRGEVGSPEQAARWLENHRSSTTFIP